jgi:general secretion pathway protein A
MYEDYFGLTKKPFSIVPDPHCFFLSAGHREALAHLLYGIKSDGGFVLLTGDIGAGKTTACRRLIELLPPDLEVAFILNPKLTVEELLATICDEFGISYPQGNQSIKVFVSLINDYLFQIHAQGRRAVLILEEAQNLKPEVLEQIRLLTNLETKDHKLLQMIMIGQPELKRLLAQPQLLQLSQRITARYHLGPLSKEEIPRYINYRLSIAGMDRNRLFPPSTLKKLFRLSGGLPRLINVICDRALLGAFVQGKDQVDKKTLIKAAREISGNRGPQRPGTIIVQFFLAVSLLVLFVALGTAFYLNRSGPLPEVITKKVVQTIDPMESKIIPIKDTLERPKDMTGEETKKKAYDAIFRKWRLAYKRGDLCKQGRAQGLQCLKGKGSLIMLRQMNKPAVLTLVDGKKGKYYAALTSLQGETATCIIGNETRTIDFKEIDRWWSGDYQLLWRAPSEYTEKLKPGSRGPMVTWLERPLSLALKRAVSAGQDQVYDGEMVGLVEKFQSAIGLMPDGIVGPRTIMPLMTVAGYDDPALYAGKGNL